MYKYLFFVFVINSLGFAQEHLRIAIGEKTIEDVFTKSWLMSRFEINAQVLYLMPGLVDDALKNEGAYVRQSTHHNATPTSNPCTVTIEEGSAPNKFTITASVANAINGTFRMEFILFSQDVNYALGFSVHAEAVLDTNTMMISISNPVATVVGNITFTGLGFSRTISQPMDLTVNFKYPLSNLTYANYGFQSLIYNTQQKAIVLGFINRTKSVTINSSTRGSTVPPPGVYASSSSFRITPYNTSSTFVFSSWSVNGSTSTDNPLILAMNNYSGNVTVTPTFQKEEEGMDKRGIDMFAGPDRYFMSDNFPNPFNPTTQLTFGLPQDSYVSILVYDNIGRKIVTVASDFYSAGIHTAKLDMRFFADGTYFCVMTSNSFRSIKKLVLLK
jgi:hypothetical protein